MTDAPANNATGSEQDKLVSDAYREIAHERTPGHLDKAVLDAAAKAARPRYSLLTSWTRPAAWAATIMLSVALVLELSQSPVQQAPKMEAQELGVQDTELLQRADEMARARQGQNDQPAQPVPQPKERLSAPAASAALSSKSTLADAELATDNLGPCDATVTVEPEPWLACIVELEEAGLTDIARGQRQLLAEAFPDFKPR